jgi:hypothetical protein
MSSMKNQISEVIKEELNESFKSNTEENSKTDQKFKSADIIKDSSTHKNDF